MWIVVATFTLSAMVLFCELLLKYCHSSLPYVYYVYYCCNIHIVCHGSIMWIVVEAFTLSAMVILCG